MEEEEEREGEWGEEEGGEEEVSVLRVSTGAMVGAGAVGVLVSIGGRVVRSIEVELTDAVEVTAVIDEATGTGKEGARGGMERDGGGGKEGSRRPADAGRFMPCEARLARLCLCLRLASVDTMGGPDAEEGTEAVAEGVVGEAELFNFNFPVATS